MATDLARHWTVRAAIVGVPVTLFASMRPDPFLVTVTSPGALVRLGLLAVVLTAISRLLRRFVPNSTVQTAVPALLAVAVLALVVLPYFRDQTVVESHQGTQNYAVPAGIDVSAPHTVLIWCRAFAVPVANASQAPVS